MSNETPKKRPSLKEQNARRKKGFKPQPDPQPEINPAEYGYRPQSNFPNMPYQLFQSIQMLLNEFVTKGTTFCQETARPIGLNHDAAIARSILVEMTKVHIKNCKSGDALHADVLQKEAEEAQKTAMKVIQETEAPAQAPDGEDIELMRGLKSSAKIKDLPDGTVISDDAGNDYTMESGEPVPNQPEDL